MHEKKKEKKKKRLHKVEFFILVGNKETLPIHHGALAMKIYLKKKLSPLKSGN